jgi:hypothetical protein
MARENRGRNFDKISFSDAIRMRRSDGIYRKHFL